MARLVTDGATERFVAVATFAAMFEAMTSLTAAGVSAAAGADVAGKEVAGAAFARPDTC